MSISIRDLLLHILEEIEFLVNESSSLSEEKFLADERAKRAFARSFEIIGEASKNIPDACFLAFYRFVMILPYSAIPAIITAQSNIKIPDFLSTRHLNIGK